MNQVDVLALKVGDEVGVSAGQYGPPTVERVTKRTATQVLLGDRRFNKYGRMLGTSGYYGRYLLRAEDAKAQAAEYMRRNGKSLAQRALRDFNWGGLELEQCQQVQVLLDSFKARATTEVPGQSQENTTAK